MCDNENIKLLQDENFLKVFINNICLMRRMVTFLFCELFLVIFKMFFLSWSIIKQLIIWGLVIQNENLEFYLLKENSLTE